MSQVPFVKRFLLGLVGLLVLQVALAPAAAAGGPMRVRLDIPSPGTIPSICAFDINYSVDVNNEFNIISFDSSGNPVRVITEGHLVVTFTNASNGNHLTLNISGPGKTTINPDGSQTIVFLGNGVLFTATDVVYSTGRVVIVAPNPLSQGSIVSATGIQRSLCSMLA